jgi:hypothetical protein
MSQATQPQMTAGNQQTQTTTPTDWGALALGGLNTLSKFALPTSDRTLKTDITPIGKDPTTGIPLHAYRYKGDPKTYPKVVGPMAQDVAKVFPDAVKRVGGKLTVHPAVMGALTAGDTVPALLTPGEAVLTKGVAQKVGRGKIAAANAASVRHYAKGTSFVTPPDLSLGTNPVMPYRPRRGAPGAPDFTLGRSAFGGGILAVPHAHAPRVMGALGYGR